MCPGDITRQRKAFTVRLNFFFLPNLLEHLQAWLFRDRIMNAKGLHHHSS